MTTPGTARSPDPGHVACRRVRGRVLSGQLVGVCFALAGYYLSRSQVVAAATGDGLQLAALGADSEKMV